MELPSVWSSDPVEFSQQEDGFALAKFIVPDNLAKGFVLSDWQVNLSEMNAATRTVSGVTEIIGFSNEQ